MEGTPGIRSPSKARGGRAFTRPAPWAGSGRGPDGLSTWPRDSHEGPGCGSRCPRAGAAYLPRQLCAASAGTWAARGGVGAPAEKATRALESAGSGPPPGEEVVSALPFPRSAQTGGAAVHGGARRAPGWRHTRRIDVDQGSSPSGAAFSSSPGLPLTSYCARHTTWRKFFF